MTVLFFANCFFQMLETAIFMLKVTDIEPLFFFYQETPRPINKFFVSIFLEMLRLEYKLTEQCC